VSDSETVIIGFRSPLLIPMGERVRERGRALRRRGFQRIPVCPVIF
jgi:hypothetical protein